MLQETCSKVLLCFKRTNKERLSSWPLCCICVGVSKGVVRCGETRGCWRWDGVHGSLPLRLISVFNGGGEPGRKFGGGGDCVGGGDGAGCGILAVVVVAAAVVYFVG